MIDLDTVLRKLSSLAGVMLTLEELNESYCVISAKVEGIPACHVGFNPHAVELAQMNGVDVEEDIAQFILDDTLPLYRARRFYLSATAMSRN